jgi:hypothetical protein
MTNRPVLAGPSGKFYSLVHVSAFWGDEERRANVQFAGSSEVHLEVFDSKHSRNDWLTELERLIEGRIRAS